VKDIMEREGVDVRLKSECIALAKQGDEITMTIECEGDRQVRGSHLLLAVGRRPNTDDLGFGKSGRFNGQEWLHYR